VTVAKPSKELLELCADPEWAAQTIADLQHELGHAKALLRRWGTERDPEVMSTIGELTHRFLQPELNK